MKRLLTACALLPLLLLGACAFTPYTRMWMGYGYADTRMTVDTFKVTFQGLENDGTLKTTDLALLRSAEVTLASGFRYFIITDEKNELRTETREIPATTTTETTTRTEGADTKTTSTTTYVPAKTVSTQQPVSVQTIRCFHEIPKDAGRTTVHDAQQLWTTLGAKYRVKREPRA